MSYDCIKRVLDIVISLIAIFITVPILFIIAVLIKLDSDGSAIFSQWRIGRGHKLFRMYKFRTMYVDAQRDATLLHENDEIFSQICNDPRLTRFGRFLRKYSIDELPQLLNILIGNMSLIGPRPLIPEESNKIPPIALKRLDIRPGLTGYAQVEGRSEAQAIDRFAHDIYYVSNLSIMFDIRILANTICVVWKKEGAI